MTDEPGLEGHEGYVTKVFADGVRASSSSSRGVHVMLLDEAGHYTGRDEVRPESEVVAWELRCSHGYDEASEWVGPRWERVDSPELEDLAARRLYPGEHGADVDERDDVEALMLRDWHQLHLDELGATARVRAAAVEVARANERLGQEVAAARRAGVTWDQVGRAAGVTRQTAHERWRHLTD